MFGKKKSLPGIVAIYYEGLPGFGQNEVLYLNHSEQGLVFIKPNSDLTATLPYEKLLNFSILREADYMLQYHNEKASTSKIKAEKWYIVITYQKDNEEKIIGLWSMAGKSLRDLENELQAAFEKRSFSSYTL